MEFDDIGEIPLSISISRGSLGSRRFVHLLSGLAAFLTTKSALFYAMIVRREIPLDDVLGKFGFQLPSKCFCCFMASKESIEHVFSVGHVAREVWSYFESMCKKLVLCPPCGLAQRHGG